MKRVGYGRVSTAGQARNGTSLAEQKKLLMAAGVAEEDIYLDAYTGTKMHRPQFDACTYRHGGHRNCQRPRGARHPRERAEHGDRG